MIHADLAELDLLTFDDMLGCAVWGALLRSVSYAVGEVLCPHRPFSLIDTRASEMQVYGLMNNGD